MAGQGRGQKMVFSIGVAKGLIQVLKEQRKYIPERDETGRDKSRTG